MSLGVAATAKKTKILPNDNNDELQHTRLELDSHTDTCVFGQGCFVVHDTGQTVAVEPYDKSLGRITGIPIVTAAVAYDCPITLHTYILFFHQSLYISSMLHHLVSPFQMRDFGVIIHETPLQHTPTDKQHPTTHSIITDHPPMHIPLTLEGTMSGFLVRKPTWQEIQDVEQRDVFHVHMTSDAPWEPRDPNYQDLEHVLRQHHQPLPIEDRNISQLHLRGQDLDLDVELSLPVDIPVDASTVTPVMDTPGGATTKGTDSEKDASIQGTAQATTIPTFEDDYLANSLDALSLLDREQRSIAAIEVDRFAATMLEDTATLSALAIHLASATTIKKRKGFVSPQILAKNWGIGLETARRTVDVTTQLAVRDFTHTTGGRRLKPHTWMLRYPRRQCKAYTDTLIAQCTSLRGNKYAQVFVTDNHALAVFPMKSKSDAHYALDDFFKDYGIPHTMVSDNAKELNEADFLRKCRRAQCTIQNTEPYIHNQMKADEAIRELRRMYTKKMTETGAPKVVWDECLKWCALVRSHTALNIFSLEGQTPIAKLTGETPDISFLAEFSFYDWVWYISPTSYGDHEDMRRKRLGRYLGPAKNVGDAMCGQVLTEKGTIVERSSIIPLTEQEHNVEAIQRMKQLYETALADKLKDRAKAIKAGKFDADVDEFDPDIDLPLYLEDDPPDNVEYEAYSPEELNFQLPELENEEKKPLPELAEADDIDFNRYISAKVMLPRDGIQFGKGIVLKRARDENGELIGKSNSNPVLDTSVYEVRFEDGAVERYHANIIAEHIYSQIDGDGYGRTLLDEIVDHRSDESAVPKSQGWYKGKNGQPKRIQTTKGWKLLVKFKDLTERWIKLKDLKESNPIELAEYAEANKLSEEPAFAWWVPWTLKQRTRILKAMKKRYFRTTQKFGVEIPKTVKRALEIDQETGTTYWRDAIEKEMGTVRIAFNILEEGEKPPPGFNFIGCHMVFDVKQGTLQRKARFVCDGSRTDASDVPTYASVVSRESVRIAFLLAALNDLDVWAADCEGAYLNAQTKEKLYTKCGPEFGPHEGRYAIIVRALYGARGSAAAWRSTISKVIEDLGFEMCRADNDVWMRKAQNNQGVPVWEYILVYSDDLLVVSNRAKEILAGIAQHFKLKEGSVKQPDQYLGANVGKKQLEDGTVAWYLSSDSYVKAAIENVERWLAKRDSEDMRNALKTKVANSMPSGYKPELDVSPLLNDDDTSYYQQQIGVLRWMCELGRIDIQAEVSQLSAYTAAPRQGHLAAVLHLYAWLKQNNQSKLVLDPTPIDHDPHQLYDWMDHYKVQPDRPPPGAPVALGKSVQTTCFVDSDHAGDAVSRRSRTGVLIFCNRAPIIFYSKKQGSIETSSFGSELTAMKTAVELVDGLRYKLRMMGCPLDGPTFVKADNMSVVHNCSNPASQLKKKSNSIAYHYVREKAAALMISVTYISTHDNLADMLTKSQPATVRKRLVQRVLYKN